MIKPFFFLTWLARSLNELSFDVKSDRSKACKARNTAMQQFIGHIFSFARLLISRQVPLGKHRLLF